MHLGPWYTDGVGDYDASMKTALWRELKSSKFLFQPSLTPSCNKSVVSNFQEPGNQGERANGVLLATVLPRTNRLAWKML